MPKVRNTSAAASALVTETIHSALAPPVPPVDRILADLDQEEAAAQVADDEKCKQADLAVYNHDYARLLRERAQAYELREQHTLQLDEKRKARRQQILDVTPPAAARMREQTLKLLRGKITAWRDFDTLPDVGVVMAPDGRVEVNRQEARRKAALEYRMRWADKAGPYVGLCLETQGPEAYKFLKAVFEFFSALPVNPVEEEADESVPVQPAP
jgi:hypothetical protein